MTILANWFLTKRTYVEVKNNQLKHGLLGVSLTEANERVECTHCKATGKCPICAPPVSLVDCHDCEIPGECYDCQGEGYLPEGETIAN